MSTLRDVPFHPFVDRHDAGDWPRTVERLIPDVHPVDRDAFRIWFSFWPLWLARAIESGADAATLERRYQLDGTYRLGDQLAASVEYLYGSRWWPAARDAVLDAARGDSTEAAPDLDAEIREVAARVATSSRVGTDLTLAITAVAAASLQRLGIERFAAIVDRPRAHQDGRKPDGVLRSRTRRSSMFRRLLGGSHEVRWDLRDPAARFTAEPGQNLTMAAATDERDHRSSDPRRVEGPIPVQCRSGACGYCWVGVLAGRRHLSPMSEFERERLDHFGYEGGIADVGESHPPVRLACQCAVEGDVLLALPPWNGVRGAGETGG